MTKISLHLLCFTSVFLCFFPTISPASLLNSKDQLPCTMCDTCDNPCHPPELLSPPPPPPVPECPPPPPPALPPSIEPECPPPPAPASPAIYYYSPPPPPPATPTSPETYYYSPPPPPLPSGGGSGCGGCYGGLPPPNSVVPYFPYSNLYPPSQDYHSTSSTLEVYFIMSFSTIFLPWILG